MAQCRICGAAEGLTFYEVREMMFGSGDRFRYFQCGTCGCLQIEEFPEDVARYYPPEYYAYTERPARRGLGGLLRRSRNHYAIFRRGVLGRLLNGLSPYPFGRVDRWLAPNGRKRSARILDVGCGNGLLLHDLAAQGFSDLLGVDPYIDQEIVHDGRARVLKKSIFEVEGPFDLVMLHHALEHIPDQVDTLRAAERLLAPGGRCLVRIPTVSSFAWEHYRENWVQLDAPRHLFLHSVESIRRVGEAAGLEIADLEHDSTELQFAGSELYARGIPLAAGDEVFSRGQLREFRRRAEELNAQKRGDSIAVYFRKAGSD